MNSYRVLYFVALLIYGYNAQDTTSISPASWNGDPLLCTVNPSGTPTDDKPLPRFPNQAEFTLEAVEIKHILNETLPSQLTLFQYIYDFDANKLILIRNTNGFIDVEYFYYERLRKSTYLRRELCFVSDIPTNNAIDGTSAILSQNGTWHIRPLNEFLLFSSNDPRQDLIRPRYIGESMVRGIPVDQWETCIINRTTLRTIKRTWSFARQGFVTPIGPVGNLAHPVQAIINASVINPDGSRVGEIDEIFDIYSWRPGIIESPDQLAPPKGVFCDSGPGNRLVSLRDAGMVWPERFSVRVEASSSNSGDWQKFHLRYERGRDRGSRRIRYDYLPSDGQNYQTVIHDYGSNLTYNIDRRVGLCKINRGVEFPDVNPLRAPIDFFIKNENRFLSSARDEIWESNGFRKCRGNSIKCASLVAGIEKFPPIVEPDTGLPSGETWDGTTVEYAWSVRSPYSRPPADMQKSFDYPVYLHLRFYQQNPNGQPPFNVRTEEIEYEFYEMSYEIATTDFDTSICYRSRDYEYLHLGFTLQFDKTGAVDGNRLDRRLLEREIHASLTDKMQIKYSRISDIDIFHESTTNEVTVLFTLLGPTPEPESSTGVSNAEATAAQARDILKNSIDGGTFRFSMKLADDMTTDVQFVAQSGTLKASKQFMSSHAAGKPYVNEYYTSGAQAGAVIGGIIIGLLVGVLVAAGFRIMRKEPMPDIPVIPSSFSNRLRDIPNISFVNKKSPKEEKPTSDA